MQVGLIGIGRQGARHFRNLLRLQKEEKIDIICVFDPDIKRAMEIMPEITMTTYSEGNWTFQPYFDKGVGLDYARGCDTFVIAAPTPIHGEIVQKIVEYPRVRGILVEKPMAMNYEEALSIHQLCQEKDILLMPGMTERFNPVIQHFYEKFRLHKTDRRCAIGTVRVGYCPPDRRAEYGGLERDLLVHDFDLAYYLLGYSPHSVYVSRFDNNPHIDIRTGMECLFVWNPTTSLNAQVCYRGQKEAKAYVIEVWFDEHAYRAEIGEHSIITYVPRSEGNNKWDKTHVEVVEREESIYTELNHFFEAVDAKRFPIVTSEEGIEVIRWSVDMVQKAIHSSGGSIEREKFFWEEE